MAGPSIDQFNTWLRSQPWYAQLRDQFGPGSLSPAEQRDLMQALTQNGVSVPSGWHGDQGAGSVPQGGQRQSVGQRYLDGFRNLALSDPRVQEAMRTGQTTTIDKIGGARDTDVHIENGQLTGVTRGGVWKPIALAAGIAAGGYGLALLAGGAPAAGGALASSTVGSGAIPAVGPLASSTVSSLGILPTTISSGGALAASAPALAAPLASTQIGQGYIGATPATSSSLAPPAAGAAAPSLSRRILNGATSPEGLAAITSGGLGFASNLLDRRAAEDEAERDREERERDRAQRNRELLSGIMGDEQEDTFRRQQAYMGTFNQNPVGQAQDIFRTAARGSIAGAGPLQINPGGVSGGAASGLAANAATYLNPEALAENAGRFYSAAGQLNPSALQPNLAAMGLPGGRQDALTQNILQAQTEQQRLQKERRDALLMGGSGGSAQPRGPAGPRAPGQNDYFSRRSPLDPRF